MKLNTDDASKHVGGAGCRGVIRDDKGVRIKDFSNYLGHCNVTMAECRGVLKGLKLTKSLGLRRVELNVDSKVVVKAIENGKIKIVECLPMIREIHRLMDQHEKVKVAHVFR